MESEFIGTVYEREIDYGNDLEFITDVQGDKETLSDFLYDFKDKKVKITIEIIKEQ